RIVLERRRVAGGHHGLSSPRIVGVPSGNGGEALIDGLRLADDLVVKLLLLQLRSDQCLIIQVVVADALIKQAQIRAHCWTRRDGGEWLGNRPCVADAERRRLPPRQCVGSTLGKIRKRRTRSGPGAESIGN